MRLFYWPSVSALQDYAPGTAIAFASNEDEAIRLVLADASLYEYDSLEAELRNTKPEVFDTPKGFAICGSA